MSLPKLTGKMLKSNITRLKAPAKITFAITYACNFLCTTCNIGRNYLKDPKGTREGELTPEEIGKMFKSCNASWIQLTGGEPFFRTDFYDIVKAVKDNCPDIYAIHTTTNGYTTQNIVNIVKKVLTLGIPRFVVSISIDGLEEKHQEIRGIPKSFKHAMETFRQLRDLENENFNVFISYTSSPNNMGLLETTMNGLNTKYGIDPKHFHMNLFHTSNHYYTNIQLKDKNEYDKKVLDELRKMRTIKRGNDFAVDFLEHKYLKFAEDWVKTGKSPLPCKALNSSCFIDAQGNVYPCLIWSKKIGNVKDFDYDLKKIWQLDEAKKAQKMAQNLKCPQCWTPCEAYQTILGNISKTALK